MSRHYTISEFAKLINVSPSTLRRWETAGRFSARRKPSGHRYYTDEDLSTILHQPLLDPDKARKNIVYCRVSNTAQKNDLDNQLRAVEAFCTKAGIAINEVICEVGSSMNMSRPKFLALIFDIINGGIETVVVADKDRLAQVFGFELVENIARAFGSKIVVAHKDEPTAEPSAEEQRA